MKYEHSGFNISSVVRLDLYWCEYKQVVDLSSYSREMLSHSFFSAHQIMSSALLLQECQQNMKSGIPALKCQNQLNGFGSHQVYPRSSCSSSELSLSSACSEYSSSSSWNDGKACKKKVSYWSPLIQQKIEVPTIFLIIGKGMFHKLSLEVETMRA